MLAGLEGFAGKAGWSALMAWVRHLIAGRVQITLPRSGESLADPKPLGEIRSFEVRGRLRRLPKDHEVWLLCENEVSKKVWPQGFSAVRYDPEQRESYGRVAILNDQRTINIIAVVAPPTSQDFFRYYQRVGDQRLRDQQGGHEPLDRIPIECTNRFLVQARIP